MQSKGVIRLVAIVIGMACLYQLSFTWVTRHQESKAKDYATAIRAAAERDPNFSINNEASRAFHLDSLFNAREKYYLDSIAAEKVFFAFTYKDCKDKELNLGLDLKGGMNVMLEVAVIDIVKALANNSAVPEFNDALKLAKENQDAGSRSDFVTLFGEAWEKVAPGQPLSRIFATYELRDYIKLETTNSQVLSVLREHAESAIANSFNVLRNRIDRFGVTQPNIQRLGTGGRILVELPGVKEPDRVRKLLQGTASLEFWKTYDNSREIYSILLEANRLIRDINIAEHAPEEAKTDLDSLIQQNTSQDWAKEYPLFSILQPYTDGQGQPGPGACIGLVHYRDTGKVMKYLNMPQVRALFPRDFRPMWSVKPNNTIDKSGVFYDLVAIKADARDGKAPLDGGVVTDARKSFGNLGTPEVDMAMNAVGAKIWAQMTKEAFGPDEKGISQRCIAIVLDDAVYSYPRVNGEITGGRSAITGNFTVQEADDLANVLKSGKLPAPARIIQEAVVGPSLGQESINAGMLSILLAFIMVLLYMLIFYKGAGVAANIALLTNVLFLFG
ncbi:MAG: protein translocase subunit SecDF, partial [Prevotellaceae bacterium]|nr:protein translocase subunit SecDF [Prevotellaceae bacterium]